MVMQREELERLIRAHQGPVYRYLRFLGAQPALAEDLVQETFLAVMRPDQRGPAQADDAQWTAWLRVVARNLLRAHWRRDGSRGVMDDPAALERAESAWGAQFPDDRRMADQLAALRQCVAELPARQREALDQRYMQLTSRSEMARRFSISEDGIKLLLRRIRAGLAKCIQQRMGGDENHELL